MNCTKKGFNNKYTRGKSIAATRGETAAILLTYLLVSRLPVVLK